MGKPSYIREDESFASRLIKHPFIWSGVGMLIRYGDDETKAGSFWRVVGVVSLAIGLGHSMSVQQQLVARDRETSDAPTA